MIRIKIGLTSSPYAANLCMGECGDGGWAMLLLWLVFAIATAIAASIKFVLGRDDQSEPAL